MKIRTLALSVAAASLALGACGGGDESISKSVLAKAIVESAKDDGAEIDADCVEKALGGLTETDLKIFSDAVKNDSDPSTGLSADGKAVMLDVVSCADSFGGISVPAAVEGLTTIQTLMLSEVMKNFEAQGTAVDEACMTDLIKGLTNEDLADPNSEAIKTLTTNAMTCVSTS